MENIKVHEEGHPLFLKPKSYAEKGIAKKWSEKQRALPISFPNSTIVGFFKMRFQETLKNVSQV